MCRFFKYGCLNCDKIGSYVDDCGISNRKSCRKVLFKWEPLKIFYENCINCCNKLGIIFDSHSYIFRLKEIWLLDSEDERMLAINSILRKSSQRAGPDSPLLIFGNAVLIFLSINQQTFLGCNLNKASQRKQTTTLLNVLVSLEECELKTAGKICTFRKI